MTRFNDCVDMQAAKNGLSPEWREAFDEAYNTFYNDLKKSFGEDAADREAAKATVEKMAFEIKRRRHLIHLEKVRRNELLKGIEAFMAKDNKTKSAKFAAGLKRVMEHTGGDLGAPFSSVQGRYTEIMGRSYAMIADLVEKFEAGLDGNVLMKRNRAIMPNLIDEMYGIDSGDGSAKYLAKAWSDLAEYLRQRFNANGGDIKKLDRWGLPQSHVAFAVRRAAKLLNSAISDNKQAWINFTKPLLDTSKMIDEITGQPISPERLDLALSNMYERIVTEGAIDLKPGQEMFMGKLANRHQESRFLVFKDGQAWQSYNEIFGEGDAFAAMLGHIDLMSRDIALIEVLGPNPKRQWDFLMSEAERRAGLEILEGKKNAIGRAGRIAGQANNMFEVFTGSNVSIDGENMTARAVGYLASALQGIQLGSAIISDLPAAPVLGAYARSFAGLSKTGDMAQFMKLFTNNNGEMSKIAKRSGIIIESAKDGLINKAYHHNAMGRFMEKLPSFVYRMNFQTAFTNARKRSFMLEAMGAFSDAKHLSLKQMLGEDSQNQGLGKTLQNWGFTERDWDLIRSAPDWQPEDGATFLRGEDIEKHLNTIDGLKINEARELAAKYGEMLQMEGLRAVPENSLYARAAMRGWFNAKGAGLWTYIIQSMTKYRGFSITMSYYWGHEFAAKMANDGFVKGAPAAAGFFAGLTIAGAASMQMKELSKGNTPRGDWNDLEGGGALKFWSAAMMQGGGLGIVGDFFNAAQSRTGAGSALTALGPVANFGADTLAIPNSISQSLGGPAFIGEEKNPNPARKILNWGARYMPWSSIWYARAVWDRAIIGNLRNMFDPDAEKYWKSINKRMEEKGQTMYFTPEGFNADAFFENTEGMPAD